MSNTRSKFESKFKERTRLGKTENNVAENKARQQQSRSAAINSRRAATSGFTPLKEESKQTRSTRAQPRGTNSIEDRKILLDKWKTEKELRKQKELEEKNKRRGLVATQSNKVSAKSKAQHLQENKVTKPVGRPPKAKEEPKRMTRSVIRDQVEKDKQKIQSKSRSIQPVEKPSKQTAEKKQQMKNQPLKNQTSTTTKKEVTSTVNLRASRTTQSKAIEEKRVTRSARDEQVVVGKKETSEPKRGRGRPPTIKHEAPAVRDKTAGKERADLKKKVVIVEEDSDSSESGRVRPRPNKSFSTPPQNAGPKNVLGGSSVKRRQAIAPKYTSTPKNDKDEVYDGDDSDDEAKEIKDVGNESLIRKRGRPKKSERRKTVGGLFTPKMRSSEPVEDTSLVATEGRKRGRPPKSVERYTPVKPAEPSSSEEAVEVEVRSTFSTDAVLGSAGRKRGRPPKSIRRRTIAVGNVGTPKFAVDAKLAAKRTRRSLEPILRRSFEADDPTENVDVLVVSPIINKKRVVENDNQILVVSISAADEEDDISPEQVPRKRGRKNKQAPQDGDVLYSLAEEDEQEANDQAGMIDAMRNEDDVMEDEDDIMEHEKIPIDDDDNVLYSLVEDPQESKSPKKDELQKALTPMNLGRKRKSMSRLPAGKLLNMSAIEPLQSISPKHAENQDPVFKTPLPKFDRRSKRYSLSVEMLKNDPKKCLKSHILKNLSPADRVEVLRHSPMIEMTRRKKSLVSDFRIDFDEEVDKCKFTDLMEVEKNRLAECCRTWKKCLEDEEEIPEDVQGQIRVAVGKAELLMKERFSQFADLIEDHVTKRSEKPVTEEDLQGFWDMVLCQVLDVDAMLDNLKKLKDNNWLQEEVGPIPMPKKKKVKAPAPAKAAVIRGVSNFAKFRKKLLDSQNVEQAAELEQTTTVVTTTVTTVVTTPNKSSENLKLFDGGFFTVESPVKNCTLESVRKSFGDRDGPGSSRKSLLGSAGGKSKLTPKSPFFMRDHSYANKKRRESAARMMSFCDSSLIADEVKPPQTDESLLTATVSSLRKRSLNNEARGNRRSMKFSGGDSFNESLSQYLKPSESTMFDSPLHHPRLSISSYEGDLITFSPSTPLVAAKPSLRRSVLTRSVRRNSIKP